MHRISPLSLLAAISLVSASLLVGFGITSGSHPFTRQPEQPVPKKPHPAPHLPVRSESAHLPAAVITAVYRATQPVSHAIQALDTASTPHTLFLALAQYRRASQHLQQMVQLAEQSRKIPLPIPPFHHPSSRFRLSKPTPLAFAHHPGSPLRKSLKP